MDLSSISSLTGGGASGGGGGTTSASTAVSGNQTFGGISDSPTGLWIALGAIGVAAMLALAVIFARRK